MIATALLLALALPLPGTSQEALGQWTAWRHEAWNIESRLDTACHPGDFPSHLERQLQFDLVVARRASRYWANEWSYRMGYYTQDEYKTNLQAWLDEPVEIPTLGRVE